MLELRQSQVVVNSIKHMLIETRAVIKCNKLLKLVMDNSPYK